MAIKEALCLINFIILVCGFIVLAAGIWIILDRDFMEELIGSKMYVTSAYILIATGSFTIIVSFLGCCGAVKEIPWMLKAYLIILFLIFVIMLTGGILAFVFREDVKEKMREKMMSSISDYGKDVQITDTWDVVQNYFQCCGVFLNETGEGSYVIWLNNTNLKELNQTVPKSCCKEKDKEMECQADPKNNTHDKGCYLEIKSFVKKYSLILTGMGIGVACALIIGMMLTCGVLHNLQRKKKRERN